MQTVLKSELLTVIINHHGAEISSIKNNDGLEFIWQADKDVWPRHAPVLFPIVGKLKDNKYTYNSSSYEMGQHGFARDLHFNITENHEDSCVFELCSGPETKIKYPFDFNFRITYKLAGNTIMTSYAIMNTGSQPMMAAVGAHPGFVCPLEASEKYEDYFLEFEKETLHQTPLHNGLRLTAKKKLDLPGKKLKLSAQLFENDALVFENNQVNNITLRSNKSSHQIKMECNNWPYFGIWSKKGNTRFICLEPWYGITDSEMATGELSEKEGMLTIEAGKEFACSFSVTLS